MGPASHVEQRLTVECVCVRAPAYQNQLVGCQLPVLRPLFHPPLPRCRHQGAARNGVSSVSGVSETPRCILGPSLLGGDYVRSRAAVRLCLQECACERVVRLAKLLCL